MPGAQCTRSFVRAEQFEYAHEYSQRRHRNHPAFPTQWSCGFLRTLPGDRAFLPPSPARRVGAVANLAPASGRQDHTASPYASRPRSSVALLASTASHPTFVTIAIRPLARRDGGTQPHFRKNGRRIFFTLGLDDPIRLNRLAKFDFARTRLLPLESLLYAPPSEKLNTSPARRANHRVARIGASDIRDSNNDADAGGLGLRQAIVITIRLYKFDIHLYSSISYYNGGRPWRSPVAWFCRPPAGPDWP
jgi:hypothetical protein